VALARLKTWIAGEVLTASDLNAEYNNILNNAVSLVSPVTAAFDFDGVTITLDAAAATQVISSAAVSWNFTSGAKTGTPATTGSIANWSAQTFTDNVTAGSGTTAAYTAFAIQRPTLAATNTLVTTTDAATWYVPNSPLAGTNETITNPWAIWVDAGNVRFDDDMHWLSGQTFAQRGILAHANTGIRTYTYPDESGTIVTTAGAAFTGAVTTSGAGTILGIGTGARMLFQQTTAPTGWTKEVSATYNDAALRFQTGTVTTGGAAGFIATMNAAGTTAAFTLTTTEISAHIHRQEQGTNAGATEAAFAHTTGAGSLRYQFSDSDAMTRVALSTQSTGGGGSHAHTLNSFDIRFVDCVIGIKD